MAQRSEGMKLIIPILLIFTLRVPVGNQIDRVASVYEHYAMTLKKVDGAEKVVERFYTPDGGHVARISGNGKVFAYAVDRDRDPPIDYLLLDPDGSGNFTKRLKPEETYTTPEWVFR